MKKKLIELTDAEMERICKKHACACEKTNCPLWFGNACVKGQIRLIQYLTKEEI